MHVNSNAIIFARLCFKNGIAWTFYYNLWNWKSMKNSMLKTLNRQIWGRKSWSRVKKIQQQYPLREEKSVEKTLHNAFQNLILPDVNYELVFSAKESDGFQEYEALFDSEGQLVQIRKSFPPSYDHVLY